MIAENAELIIAVMTILGGLIGKLWSDSGKQSIIKELDEAKTALTNTAKCVAPGVDLAYNIGIGKIPLNEETLRKLSQNASTTWVSMKSSSKECADILKMVEEIRRSK